MTPADQFSALADPTRCRVIELLHQRPMPVHELTAAFDISRPAISRHLRVLKEASLVKEEKQGRENVYSLLRPRLRPMLQWLEKHGQSKPAVARPAKAKVPAVRPAEVLAVKPASKPARAATAPKQPQMQLDLF